MSLNNRFSFVSPCGVLDSRTGEVEYFETSAVAHVEMAKLERLLGEEPLTEEERWRQIDHCNTIFMIENAPGCDHI